MTCYVYYSLYLLEMEWRVCQTFFCVSLHIFLFDGIGNWDPAFFSISSHESVGRAWDQLDCRSCQSIQFLCQLSGFQLKFFNKLCRLELQNLKFFEEIQVSKLHDIA